MTLETYIDLVASEIESNDSGHRDGVCGGDELTVAWYHRDEAAEVTLSASRGAARAEQTVVRPAKREAVPLRTLLQTQLDTLVSSLA